MSDLVRRYTIEHGWQTVEDTGGASFPDEWTVGGDGTLAITGINVDSVPLSVVGAPAQEAAFFEVIDSNDDRLLQVTPTSIVLVGVPGEQNSKLILDDDGLQFKDELAGFPLTINGGILYFGTNATAQVIDDGYFAVSAHAAPADGALNPGDCAVWFDQANGAAKLMLKAKQADGTIKTGSVNVQT